MFGKESEATPSRPSAGGGDNRSTSILAQGCQLKGEIHIQGIFRVEGEFEGTITTPEQLVVGKTGVVKGDIRVKNAIVGGKVLGNIKAENKIELQSGSHVEGDIQTRRLVIDEGVFFEGSCSMGNEKKTGGASSGSSRPETQQQPKQESKQETQKESAKS